MPTKIKKPLSRETCVQVNDAGKKRNLCIQFHPSHIEMWPKNTRYRLSISYETLWGYAELRSVGHA